MKYLVTKSTLAKSGDVPAGEMLMSHWGWDNGTV